MKIPSTLLACLIAVATITICLPANAQAQDQAIDLKTLYPGDKVEVKFINQWYAGEVTEVLASGRAIRAKFFNTSRNRDQVFLFTQRQVRPISSDREPDPNQKSAPDEKSAPSTKSKMRTWKSADGKFSLEAKLAGKENTSVRLKRKDGKVVRVPIAKLSDKDQAYLKDLTVEPENPFDNIIESDSQPAAARPPKVTRDLGQPRAQPKVDPQFKLISPDLSQRKTILEPNSRPWKFEAQAYPQFDGLNEPASISQVATFDKITRLRNLENEKRVVFALEGTFGKPPRVIVMDSATGKQLANLPFPMIKIKVGDISPDGKRVVTYVDDYKSNRMDVWEVTTERLKHSYGVEVPNGGGNSCQIQAAVFVGNDKLATTDRKRNLFVWEVDAAKVLFEKKFRGISPSRLFAVRNGERLIFSDHQRTYVLDTDTGTVIGSNTARSYNASVAVSEAGRMAVASGTKFTIFSETGEIDKEFTLLNVGGQKQMRWFGERILLISRGSSVIAVDTENRVALARYEIPAGSAFLGDHGLVWILQANQRTAGREDALFGSVLIEPLIYEETLPALGDDLLLFRPERTVAIQTDLPFGDEMDEKISQSLMEKVQAAGCKLSQNADIELRLRVVEGKSRKINVRSIGGGLRRRMPTPFDPLRRPDPLRSIYGESVTVVPSIQRFEIWFKGKQIYTSSTTRDVVGLIRSQGDETIKESIARLTKPLPAFFLDLQIPQDAAIHPEGGAYAIVRLSVNGIESERVPEFPQ